MEQAELKKCEKKCFHCNYKSHVEKDFLSHVAVHRHEKNFQIPCFQCPQISRKLKPHRKHIKNVHNSSLKENSNNEPTFVSIRTWQCPHSHCETKFEIKRVANQKNFNTIVKHLYKHAKKEKVICPIAVCQATYKVTKRL